LTWLKKQNDVAANKGAAKETVDFPKAASQNGFSTSLQKETNIIQKMKKHITFILSESSRETRSLYDTFVE
jgi:hypothetical protein